MFMVKDVLTKLQRSIDQVTCWLMYGCLVILKIKSYSGRKEMVDQLWAKSAVEQAAGIKDKSFSAVEVIQSVLTRINEKNDHLNAVVYNYADQALALAEAADKAVSSGQPLGPLHGVPVTVKVNVDVEGTPTTNGIPAFKDVIAPGNSPVVQNLLNAGAIIVGKTNTPEFSMRGTTDNPLHGLTRNPWSDTASPGGSSGGAGSAAAAGFGPIHHGNDIAGSLRFPATACGVATVKPGLGRVPAYNPSALVERGLLSQIMSVQGAICREVKDVRLATEVMINHDPRDPWHVPMPFAGPVLDAPIKVALTRESHGYPMHPGIEANLDKAARILSDAGYEVHEVDTPSIYEPADAWFSVAILEVKNTLDPAVREHGSRTIQQIFDHMYKMSNMVDAEGYMVGIAERSRMVRDWSVFLAEYPLVLTPFLMRPGYPNDYDETYEGTKDLFDSAIYSFGINYLGFPAGNVPVDLVEDLPSGVQIIGRKFREDLILDALEVIENQTGVMSEKLWKLNG
jgi:amidase